MSGQDPSTGELDGLLTVERRLEAELAEARREAEDLVCRAREGESGADARLEAELEAEVERLRIAHRRVLDARCAAVRSGMVEQLSVLAGLDAASLRGLAETVVAIALGSDESVWRNRAASPAS